jgi:hypothetical protein
VDGYVYSAAEEPKMMLTGKWSKSMSYQACDQEGDPLPGSELKEVRLSFIIQQSMFLIFRKHHILLADLWRC